MQTEGKVEAEVRQRYEQILINIIESPSLQQHAGLIDQVWKETACLYNEQHRQYHTFQHIWDLLCLANEYQNHISDRIAVDLAIIFHDVVYDPRSGTNEEDSAVFFKKRLGQILSPSMTDKVSQYIICTKKHAVVDSQDEDLMLFIDFDLHVLGSDRDTYKSYAKQIRQEYIHVEKEFYCKERPKFLHHLAGSTAPLYASEVYRPREDAARANLLWECKVLESGSLIE